MKILECKQMKEKRERERGRGQWRGRGRAGREGGGEREGSLFSFFNTKCIYAILILGPFRCVLLCVTVGMG
jgi:hypothetical protein